MDVVGAALAMALGGIIAFILWRYPDFRREFIAYWRTDAVADRLTALAERTRARRRRTHR